MNIIKKANTGVVVEAVSALITQTAFTFNGKDGKTLFVAENPGSSAVNLVVEAGDGLQATENLTLAVPADSSICFTLESGKYKKLYGDDKGCVALTGNGLKISTYLLP